MIVSGRKYEWAGTCRQPHDVRGTPGSKSDGNIKYNQD